MRSWLLMGMLFWTGCSGNDDSVDRRKCTQLRDHVIDLRLAGPPVEGVDLAQHRAAMKQSLGDGFIDKCVQSMSIDQVRCELNATDLSGTAECARTASASR